MPVSRGAIALEMNFRRQLNEITVPIVYINHFSPPLRDLTRDLTESIDRHSLVSNSFTKDDHSWSWIDKRCRGSLEYEVSRRRGLTI
jgi:hypothetical protein